MHERCPVVNLCICEELLRLPLHVWTGAPVVLRIALLLLGGAEHGEGSGLKKSKCIHVSSLLSRYPCLFMVLKHWPSVMVSPPAPFFHSWVFPFQGSWHCGGVLRRQPARPSRQFFTRPKISALVVLINTIIILDLSRGFGPILLFLLALSGAGAKTAECLSDVLLHVSKISGYRVGPASCGMQCSSSNNFTRQLWPS